VERMAMSGVMTTGKDLVHKWIQRNESTKTREQMEGTTFVYGDSVYRITKAEQGGMEIEHIQGKVVIFRDMKEMSDEFTCRICGTEFTNQRETILCCINEDE
jgi:hypothetical protein